MESLSFIKSKKLRQHFSFSDWLNDGDDDRMLAAYRRYEQSGGNPIFRAEFAPAGHGRVFRDGAAVQRRYRLTFQQLRDAEGEELGEALTEAVLQGLRKVVTNEGFEVANYDLLLSVHSNSFQQVWQQSPNIPLAEWLSHSEYTQAWMEQLAKRLNSGEVMDIQQDAFYVELTFVRRLGRGGKNDGKKVIQVRKRGKND